MQEKIIKKLVENAIKELESIDYTTRVTQTMTLNNKKVHKAYNILFDLNQKLEEEYRWMKK